MSKTPSDATIDPTNPRETRREFLYLATGAVGAVGTAAFIWPLIDSLNPSADVLALTAVEVDLTGIAVGQRITVKWRANPVFIDHRTPKEIEGARADDNAEMRDPEPDSARVQRPEWLIVVGICTHLGCVPVGQKLGSRRGRWDGWFCPCHGSQFDTSGRIRKGPAPTNLVVPPYEFLNDRLIRIG